jgi:transcriptional regulator GlxA family with amidase domain
MRAPVPAFAILAYDGIEPIDIGATYGVLSMAKRLAPDLRFFVTSKSGGELVMANGLRLLADHGFADCPAAEILMVLGGPGWQTAAGDAAILSHIRDFHRSGGTVAAVCTGGMIVGAAGLLDGLAATTKREIVRGEARPLDLLSERCPGSRVIEARVVDTGRILTGGGVSLGIDMTLHLLQRYLGRGIAEETARILEYRSAWNANAKALPDLIGEDRADAPPREPPQPTTHQERRPP